MCVTPGGSGGDRVYFVVKRTINGATKRFVEWMDTAQYMDCQITNTNSPTGIPVLTISGTTLTGLSHLEGETVDIRADVYSLGCTFYHMLTGQPPAPEGTPAKKLHHHEQIPPTDPRQLNPEIPHEAAIVLARMMAKSPGERYQEADQLVQHLLVLAVVVLGTMISAATGFEKTALVSLDQIDSPAARADFEKFAKLESSLKEIKSAQSAIQKQLAALSKTDVHDYSLEAEALRLEGEEKSLKKQLYGLRVATYRHALEPVQLADGSLVYRDASSNTPFVPAWRLSGIKDGQFKLSGGGQVVGAIPSGLPGFNLPILDLGVISSMLGIAFVIAMIGFMEATSISRALAAQSREKLDPNQELIGQGLANIVGSFFQSYVVSGSFSRSAVAAKSGAKSGFFAIVSALAVLVVILFFTRYFYHLPQPVLAAIVMSAVFGLIDFKTLKQKVGEKAVLPRKHFE